LLEQANRTQLDASRPLSSTAVQMWSEPRKRASVPTPLK
jgi:hypothetical protein